MYDSANRFFALLLSIAVDVAFDYYVVSYRGEINEQNMPKINSFFLDKTKMLIQHESVYILKSVRFTVHTHRYKTNVEKRDSENRPLIILFTIAFLDSGFFSFLGPLQF